MTTRQVGSLFVALQVHDRATASLGAFDSRLESSERKSKNLSQSVTDLGVGLTKLSAPATAFFGFATKAAIDFESAFAGVIKTVDASDAQLGALRDTIRDMATDPSNPLAGLSNAHQTIAQIMELGGQLGVPVGELESFAQVIGELGISTNLTTEEAAVMTAQFANITGMDFSNFDRFGATIVELGNNLATNERDIAIFAQRLAGIGSTVGLTEDQILALGGAMASVGLNAEAGGTAMTQTFNAMISAVAGGGSELESFARVAGTSASDFAALWEADPQAALQGFLEGLGALDQAAQVQALDDLGLDGIRVADTLRRLSANTDLVANSFDLAAGAWKENNALSEEAQKRLETTAAQFNVFKNTIMDLAISVGDILLPGFNKMLAVFQGLIVGVRETVDAFPGVVRVVAKFASIIGVAGAAMIGFGQALAIIPILFNPVTLAIGAVAAAIVGLTELWNSDFLGIKTALKPLTDAFGWTFRRIERFINRVIEAFKGGGLTAAVEAFKSEIGDVWGSIARKWGSIDFGQIASDLVASLGRGIKAIIGGAAWVMENLINPLIDRVKSIDIDFSEVAQNALDALSQGWDEIVTAGTWVKDNLIDPLVEKAAALGGEIDLHAMADAMLGALGSAWSAIVHGGTWVLDNLIKPLPEAAKTAIESVDWFGVGEGIVNGIGSAIQSGIDFVAWLAENIFTPATEKASDAISSVGWESIATGIMDAIGSAFGAYVDFVQWFNDTVTIPLISGAISAIQNADWANIASDIMSAIGAVFSAGIDLAAWFLDNVLTPLVSNAKTAIENIDWYNVGYDVMTAIGNALTSAFDFVAWIVDSIFGPTTENAEGAANSIDWGGVATTVMNAIGSAFGAVIDFVVWVTQTILSPLLRGMIAKIGEINWDRVPTTLFNALKTAIGAVWNVATWVWENLISPLLSGLVTKIGETDWGAFGSSLLDSLAGSIGNMAQWAYDHLVQPILDAVSNISISANLDPFSDDFGIRISTGSATRFQPGITTNLGVGGLFDVAQQTGATLGAQATARAHGGPVFGGQPYIVGEVGPELFVPSGNGEIVPNYALGGGSGGGPLVGTMVIHANSDAEGRVAGRAAWEELEELWRARG